MRSPEIREAAKLKMRVWRAKNLPRARYHARVTAAKVRARDPEAERIKMRKWRAKNPHKQRQYQLKHFYNMTETDRLRMVIDQHHACAICLTEKFDHELQVDHSHTTGVVRGLLCGGCNKAIGLMKDSIEALQNAAMYLKAAQ